MLIINNNGVLVLSLTSKFKLRLYFVSLGKLHVHWPVAPSQARRQKEDSNGGTRGSVHKPQHSIDYSSQNIAPWITPRGFVGFRLDQKDMHQWKPFVCCIFLWFIQGLNPKPPSACFFFFSFIFQLIVNTVSFPPTFVILG